jgi:hypothetical protein
MANINFNLNLRLMSKIRVCLQVLIGGGVKVWRNGRTLDIREINPIVFDF